MRAPLIGSIALSLFIAENVHAQKYPIQLSNPDRVGQTYSLSATGSRHQQVSATQDGHLIKSQTVDLQVTFQGREEILALDGNGQAVRESFTVEKFTKTEDRVTTILLKPGSVILTDASQERTFQVVLKGGVLDDYSRAAFSLVRPPVRPSFFDGDEVYGTSEAKGVGDSWPINRAAAVDGLNETMIIPMERTSGTSSIVSMDTIGGDQCLNMVTEVKADGVSLKNGPPGFGADRGTLRMAVREGIPTSTTAISRKAGAEINSQFQVKGIPGSPAEGITLETTVSQKLEMVALAARP